MTAQRLVADLHMGRTKRRFLPPPLCPSSVQQSTSAMRRYACQARNLLDWPSEAVPRGGQGWPRPQSEVCPHHYTPVKCLVSVTGHLWWEFSDNMSKTALLLKNLLGDRCPPPFGDPWLLLAPQNGGAKTASDWPNTYTILCLYPAPCPDKMVPLFCHCFYLL